MKITGHVPAQSPGTTISVGTGRSARLSLFAIGAIFIFAPMSAFAGVRASNLNDSAAENVALTASISSNDPGSFDLIHSPILANSYSVPMSVDSVALAAVQSPSTSLPMSTANADGLKIGAAKTSTPPLLIPVPTAFSSGLVGLVMLGIGGGLYRAHRRGLLRG